MMQHRIWHRRQHKQRWACIGIDKVGPKRGAKELMAGVRAQQQESLNAEGGVPWTRKDLCQRPAEMSRIERVNV